MVAISETTARRARITFELDPDVKRQFKGFCGSAGLEMTEVLEQAVIEILTEHRGGQDLSTEGVQS